MTGQKKGTLNQLKPNAAISAIYFIRENCSKFLLRLNFHAAKIPAFSNASLVIYRLVACKVFMLTIILALVSCRNDSRQEKPKQDTPKALEQNNSAYEMISKRGYEDLIERLYNEEVGKDTSLKKLEETIEGLNKNKSQVTEPFDQFNEKNQTYFSSANGHIAGMKDSLSREKIKNLVAAQLAKYNVSIAKHNELLKLMEAKQLTIADLHTVVKIVRTLPLIDKYQKDNLPGTKSMVGYLEQQEKAIQLADTLSKKTP